MQSWKKTRWSHSPGSAFSFWVAENNPEECWRIMCGLENMPEHALKENAGYVLLYLAALKSRPLDRIKSDKGFNNPVLDQIALVVCLFSQYSINNPCSDSVLPWHLAQIWSGRGCRYGCKYLKEASLPHERSTAQHQDPSLLLEQGTYCQFQLVCWYHGVNPLPLPSSGVHFPHMSNDIRFFDSHFNFLIFQFLMDIRRAGEFFVPRDVLFQDLDRLCA